MGAIIHARGGRGRFLAVFALGPLFWDLALPRPVVAAIGSLSEQDIYGVDSAALLRSRSPRNWDSIGAAGRFYEGEAEAAAPPQSAVIELPEVTTTRPGDREFREYWRRAEEENGIGELRGRLKSWDIDKTWVPHLYFFDSSLVIFPGWIVLRRKPGK